MVYPRNLNRPKCLVSNCDRKATARGLCPTHYHFMWSQHAWVQGRSGSLGGDEPRIKRWVREFVEQKHPKIGDPKRRP